MLAPVVTRRYAEALLDAAQAANAVADVEADLALLHEVLADPAVAALLTNPTIEVRVQRQRFLDPLAPRLRSKLVRNTIGLLIDRRRAEVLTQLPSTFRRLALEARGEAEGTVESARELSAAEVRAIEEAVSAAMVRRVTLAPKTDPSLIGGVRATVGSQRFDLSVRARFAALRERLLAARLPG
jgi:F-type H+-transporting ATPase subunit delta